MYHDNASDTSTTLMSILQAGSHYSHITARVTTFGQTFVLRLIKNR